MLGTTFTDRLHQHLGDIHQRDCIREVPNPQRIPRADRASLHRLQFRFVSDVSYTVDLFQL